MPAALCICHGVCAEYLFGESEPDTSRRRTPLQGNESEEGERSNFASVFIMYFKTLPKEIMLNPMKTFLLQWR